MSRSTSRGRHSLPEPPGSGLPLLVIGLAVAALAVAAIWLVDESVAAQVGTTAAIVVVVVLVGISVWSDHRVTTAMWQEALDRRHELMQIQRELADLRSQHTELLLELRTLRSEVVAASDEVARGLRAANEHSMLMQELLMPRPAQADPVYPSLHLPLVRAAFAAEIPTQAPSVRPAEAAVPETATSGAEPSPPRQLLDLTASEIARLRPAN